MTSFRIRPRFEMQTSRSVEEIIGQAQTKLHEPGIPCRGLAVHDHITLRMPKHELHFWSPQLNVTLLRDEQQQLTRILGVYGPMPNVWTMFAGGYLALSFLFMFVCIVGFSRMSLGMECYILWLLPLLALLAAALYILSQLGQKLGAEQTFTIHHFFEEMVGQRVHIS